MVQCDLTWPAVNQRSGVEIFDAADPQPNSLGAGSLYFNSGLPRFRHC